MKTWFDWMDCYYEPAVQEIADDQETKQLKKIVMERLGPQASCVQPSRLGLRKAVVVIAAAVIVCCMGMGALAAVEFPWDGIFGNYFGTDAKEKATELEMPGEGLELSSTDAGCTLTLNGALFDGEKLYLPLTLSLDQDVPNADWSYYAMGTTDQGEGSGAVVLPDEDPNDHKVELMCTLSGSSLKSGKNIVWNIKYLYANRADEAGNTQTVWEKEGEWNFSFVVPEAQPALEWSVPDGTCDPVTGIAVAQVRLTTMRLSLVFDGLPEDAAVRDTLSESQIVLCFENGTTRPLGSWEDGMREAQGSIDAEKSPIGKAYYEVSCEYGDLIDPAQITAIEVNGCRISAQ